MQIESFIRLLAGSVVLLSVVLVSFVSPWWLLLTCFVGLNLVQSALTGFCPPTLILTRLGWLDAAGRIHWGGPRSGPPPGS